MEATGESGDALFLGEYQHALDEKGRLILPSAFREHLDEGLVMTLGLDRCVAIHPHADWQRVLAGLRNLRTTDREERKFARMVTSSAHAEELDRQGRVTIPPRLREYAGLRREVTVVGADFRVELWDTATWERYRDQGMADFAATEHPFDIGGMF